MRQVHGNRPLLEVIYIRLTNKTKVDLLRWRAIALCLQTPKQSTVSVQTMTLPQIVARHHRIIPIEL